MKKLKNKFLGAMLIVFQMVILFPISYFLAPDVKANIEKTPLMVSAYYSPLPGQSFYMRGSYEADMILNGRGTNGADGTQVYVGMLAAPRTYPFGTRIKIPGLGVGEVHDRGGAIIAHKNYDRIDVWMGKGEEGLARALNWGMRLVDGEVDFTKVTLSPGLDYNWVSPTLPSGTLARLKARTSISTTAVAKPVSSQSSKTSIRDLQDILRLFGYYHGPVDGEYSDETKQAVLTFQLAEGVIATKDSFGAGNYGPKTTTKLQEVIERFNSDVAKEQARLRGNLKSLTVGLGKDASGERVNELQKMLWELGYYYGPLSGNYDNMTTDAVFRFQKDYGVIQDDSDNGAGYFGPKTHTAIVAAVNKKALKIAEGPKEMQSWVPSSNSLPTLDHLQLTEVKQKPKIAWEFFSPAKKTEFASDIELNQKGEEVARLQNVLIKEGLLPSDLNTGYFGSKTQKALIDFQIKHKVIASATDQGAGRVGPGTREVLNRI